MESWKKLRKKYVQYLLGILSIYSTSILLFVSVSHALHQVNDTEKRLKDWKTIISALYNKYNKLLFFSVSKVLSIYEILKNKDFCADKLMQEIGFLFKNDDEAMKALKVVIEVRGMHAYV